MLRTTCKSGGQYGRLSVHSVAIGFERRPDEGVDCTWTPENLPETRPPSGRRPSCRMFACGSRKVCVNLGVRDTLGLRNCDSRSFAIQLLRMSDGQPHPSASAPSINGPRYKYGREWVVDEIQVQLTCSRLAVTVQIFAKPRVPHFIVWDWKTGVKYVVSSDQVCCTGATMNHSPCRIFCAVRKLFNSLMSTGYLGCQNLRTPVHGGRSHCWIPLFPLRIPGNRGR